MTRAELVEKLRSGPPARSMQAVRLETVSQLTHVLLVVREESPEFVRGAQDKALKADVHEGDCPDFEAAS